MQQSESRSIDQNAIYLLPVQVQAPADPNTGFQRYWQDISGRWPLVAAATVLALAAGFAISLTIPRQYRAEIVLAAVNEEQGSLALSGSIGALSGLAGLVGLGTAGSDLRNAAIATLDSKSLAAEFIRDHQLLTVLFADQWDAESQQWKPRWFGSPPTLADAVRYFDENIRSVSEDRKTGLITLRIEWRDRAQAAAWATELVARVNAHLREQVIAEAKASLDYLERDAERTRILPLRDAAYRLTEQELKRIMFANIRTDYALRIIDPAMLPEENEYVRPRPLLLVTGFGFLGFAGGSLLTIALGLRQRRRSVRKSLAGPPN
ncbi:MAG: hypothetical protein AMXMBFR8_11990 [Nevskiales bacterium]